MDFPYRSKIMKLLATWLFALACVSCSDFHFAIVPNGSLASQENDRDTIRIPADSIVVENLFATNDKLFQADASIRASRNVEIPLHLSTLADAMDSVVLYGTIVATDTLQIGIKHGGVTDPVVDIQIEASDFIHHQIRMPIHSGIDYTVLWKSLDGKPVKMGALLLVGYPSKSSAPLNLVNRVKDYLEVLPVHFDSALTLPAGASYVKELTLEPSDSVYAMLSGGSGISSFLLNQTQLDEFMVNGDPPSKFLWQGEDSASTLRWFSDTPIRLNVLISNFTTTDQTVADSISIFRHLQE
jgi:hypothetical protein